MVVRASPQEGVFPNAIEVDVSVELPNGETRNLTARVSVIIKQPPDPSTIVSPETGLSIFPESIVASPGETITLTVAGLESQGSTARLEWSLESTHLGELSQAGVLKVKNFPGSYPGAIKVKVVGQSTPGRETELKADLVIRGTLERIEAFPKSINIKPGDSVQLRVTAYDSNGVELPLGSARFRVTNPKAGRVDDRGVFIAGSEFGHYPGAIEVEVSQVVSTNE